MRARGVWIFALAALGIAGRPYLAGAQDLGTEEFQVNSYTTGAQGAPSVASDAGGNFVVVWQSEQDGSSNGIFGQRYDSAGGALGEEFQVNAYTPGSQSRPSVASDASGHFVVVWDSFGQDGEYYGVFGQRYDSGGTAQGAEFRVNTFTAGTQGGSSVASDAGGNFVVVWEGVGPGDASGVFGQRYDSGGAPQGGQFRVNSYTTGFQATPSVVSGPDGGVVVVWHGQGATDGNGVFGQRYDSAGVPRGSQFRVNSDKGFIQQVPAVASDASGDFVVVWESYGQDGSNFGIFGRRYDNAGRPQGPSFRVNSFTSGSQSGATVASDADGNFVVIWYGAGQVDGSGVFGQRYDSEGQALGSAFRVNSYTTGTQRFAAVASDTAGDFVVAWQSRNQDGSDEGVFGRRRQLTHGRARP